ncbi:MAG: putative solute-binding protein [Pseudomonadota bacterium]
MSPTLLSAARSTLVTAWFCLSGLAVAAGPAPSAADIIASQGAQAMQGKKVTVCVFDPLGKNGPAYASAKEYMLEGKRWGINATVEAYVSEGVLVDDLKAGQCDGITISTLRAKKINSFVGSLDAVGAIPDAAHMNMALAALADPKMAPLMVSGAYEIAGIVPLGAAYVMVRDRRINSIETAAGKKIAVLDWDKSQARMVEKMGAQAVASDITNFFTKFNNGQVDIIAAPAIAFKPLELYRGVGTTGGINRFPLVYVSSSLVIRTDRFPPGSGQKLRTFIQSQVPKAFEYVAREEKSIEPKYWMDIPPNDQVKYVEMMRQARMSMVVSNDYDPRMLKLLKRVRCKRAPGLAECSTNDE